MMFNYFEYVPAIGVPSLDYKRFLSDTGSGLVASASLAIVIYICGTNDECHISKFVTELYNYFRPIFLLLTNNAGISGDVIILTIVIFISIILGFTVNALSYLLLDDLIDRIVDNACFQKILRISNSNNISYYGIEKFSDHFSSIDEYFGLKNKLSDCKRDENRKYEKCLIEIKTRLSIECPNIVGNWGEVHGGYIMFRNFVFIILFCLFLTFLSFWDMSNALSGLLFILIAIPFAIPFLWKLFRPDGSCDLQKTLGWIKKMLERRMILGWIKDILSKGLFYSYIFRYIALAFMTPLLIGTLPVIHNSSGFCGLSTLGSGTIVISIISLNILFFLSAFALTYYHYRIFIAAMYVSLGKKWKKEFTYF
ncbi:hypothetical protein DRO03_10100 [Methanosarcinales archaeon]|nr:MAG: hypothetical protein DRO03_10100 [Methanosarcinales archaeon]